MHLNILLSEDKLSIRIFKPFFIIHDVAYGVGRLSLISLKTLEKLQGPPGHNLFYHSPAEGKQVIVDKT